METIAIMNVKGGTGKTVTAYALSRILTERGYKVLAVDADWQGTLALMCGINTLFVKTFIEDILSEKSDIAPASLETAKEGFTVVPCRLSFHKESERIKRTALKNALSKLAPHYDYCIIDAPPYADPWAEAILMAAQAVIIPEHMGDFRVVCLEIIRGLVISAIENGNPDLKIAGVLYTEAEDGERRKLLLDQTAKRLETKVFNTQIHYDEFLDRLRVKNVAKHMFSLASFVGDEYRAFVDEFFGPVQAS